ncbi:MAG: leucine-rich repeat protein [Acetobacter sp.]|nr:leucine-rich repeat protein [Bacteroides sp.]MCM1341167.1 leucine-rich repeat protein [Acetobacter sp.]MCM1433499.1 leucine-rich repeat protein [Clostridiales bacterium]
MKKILSFILSAVIIITSVSGMTITANADTGSCGANVSYNFNSDTGALVISGTGAMTDYSTNNRPVWFGKEVKTIAVQSGVTSIGNRAFQSLSSVTAISIADTVKSIGERAFEGAAAGASPLIAINISANVESIGDKAFRGMTKVSAFNVNGSNKNFSSDDGVLYNKDKTVLIAAPPRVAVDTLILPSTLTEIKADAFYKSQTVKNIIMPASVNIVGDGITSVFSSSSDLTVYYSNNSEFGWSAYLKNSNINGKPYPVISFKYCNGEVVDKEYMPFTKGSDVIAPVPTKPLINGDKTHNVYSFSADYADVTENAEYNESFVTEPCDFSKYDIVKEPTVLENGIGRYTCVVCGCTDDVVIPKEPCYHNGERKIVGAINPTCTENGYSGDEVCLLCNQYVNYGEAVEATGHHHELSTVVNPICTEQGYTVYKCADCDDSYEADYVEATGHSYDIKVTKPASCTSTGIVTYTCTACEETKNEVIAKTSHKYKTATAKATASKNGSRITKCTDCNAVKSNTVIPKISTINLSATTYTYNGKARTPAVTVKDISGKTLKKNTDYTVTYAKGRKAVGKYSVKITFKGNYSGTASKTFTIIPKSTSVSKLTKGKKKFTVKWKKLTTQTTGYQIQYSTDKKFKKNNKTITVGKNKTTSKTISKLKAKKKYYVRIRTYKTIKVNGKNTKIYSSWSKSKTVTTKK